MKPSSVTSDDQLRWERIAAYLDGELSPTEQALIELQLAEDPEFRREVLGIERAWEALDTLPDTEVNSRFAQTTMELVVDAARQELTEQTRAMPRLRRQRTLGQVLSLVAAGLLGLLVVRLVQHNPNRLLVAELPAIKYLDAYGQFTDVSFLRMLRQRMGDTPWLVDVTPEELQERTAEFDQVSQRDRRRDWLAAIDDDQRAALRARYNRFVALSDKDQRRLHDLHESVAGAEDHAQLVDTLLHYQQWLGTLSASQQYELRELDPQLQVARIETSQRRVAEVRWIELTPEQYQLLRSTLRASWQQLLESLSPELRSRLEASGGFGGAMLLARRGPGQRERFRAAILEALPADKRAQFLALPPQDQQVQLQRWMRDIFQPAQRDRAPHQRREQVSQEELERFFSELDATLQERLLAQPREEFERSLRRLYLWGEVLPEGDPFGPLDLKGRQHTGPRPFGGPPRGGSGPRNFEPGFGPPPPEEGGPPPQFPPVPK
jgi:hypothetical protein